MHLLRDPFADKDSLWTFLLLVLLQPAARLPIVFENVALGSKLNLLRVTHVFRMVADLGKILDDFNPLNAIRFRLLNCVYFEHVALRVEHLAHIGTSHAVHFL